MAAIKVQRQHDLGTDKAREKVEAIAQKLQSDLDAEYHWDGDTLKFSRSGASGHIDVGENELSIEIKLGMLLSPLKGTIEKTLQEQLDEHLSA